MGDKEIRITPVKCDLTFCALASLRQEYGKGGIRAIRQNLNLIVYNSKVLPQSAGTTGLPQEARNVFQTTRDDLPATDEIPLQDFTTSTKVKEVVDTAGEIDTSLNQFLESFLPEKINQPTQSEGLTSGNSRIR